MLQIHQCLAGGAGLTKKADLGRQIANLGRRAGHGAQSVVDWLSGASHGPSLYQRNSKGRLEVTSRNARPNFTGFLANRPGVRRTLGIATALGAPTALGLGAGLALGGRGSPGPEGSPADVAAGSPADVAAGAADGAATGAEPGLLDSIGAGVGNAMSNAGSWLTKNKELAAGGALGGIGLLTLWHLLSRKREEEPARRPRMA